MLIFYTTEEGGLWHPLEVPLKRWEVAQMLMMYRDSQDKLTSLAVDGRFITVHSVLFQNNNVWDSHYGMMMKHPQPGYYEEVKQLIGGDRWSGNVCFVD